MGREQQINIIVRTVAEMLCDMKLSEKNAPKRVRLTLYYDGSTAEYEADITEESEQ